MKRRQFLQNTAISAMALSTTGFVQFNGKSYEGDCETTSDILGPFYRPGSPVRSNLLIPGEPGQEVVLSGVVLHKDCTTPYKEAKVELWHCSTDGTYDNSSPEYRYRGTTLCDAKGKYEFLTILPVPYDAGGGNIRPAHFHLLVSAPGYQSLVTQLYFTGDSYLKKDSYAAAPTARRRILDVKNDKKGRKLVTFNVTMAEKLAAEPSAIDRLLGTYTFETNSAQTIEFFQRDGQLWGKLGSTPYGMYLEYTGNNTFALPGFPSGMSQAFAFDIQEGGVVKTTLTRVNAKGEKSVMVAVKNK